MNKVKRLLIILLPFIYIGIIGCGGAGESTVTDFMDAFQSRDYETAFKLDIVQKEVIPLEQYERTKRKAGYEQEHKGNPLSTAYALFASNMRYRMVDVGEPEERQGYFFNYVEVDLTFANEKTAPCIQFSGRSIIDKILTPDGINILKDKSGIRKGVEEIRIRFNIIKYMDPATDWLIDTRLQGDAIDQRDPSGIQVMGGRYFDGETWGDPPV